jgi:transposase
VSEEVPLRVMLALSAADQEALVETEKKHPDWRVRERARSVLLLAQGKTCAQVAALQALSMRTVSNTRQRWIAAGLSGLADRPRRGAPAKVSKEEAERLLQWARDEPLTLTALKARHEAAGGTPVHVNTLKALLTAGGLVWKRTRHSLKKNAMTGHLNAPNKK